ncbi:hypothetical protein BC938DRAFT_475715 [Jimgerdemannia flammicorona]|uniref:TatD family n=1 Tax=Jimgerdemannia flammicorona TaxID=994334 RepID=A0A433QRD6_9FUNG|nr:hypothetical protein BC938DRAFT_475715 [Jimgerdemannia flammicorona]
MPYIDVHAHLNPTTFPATHPTHSLDLVISRARAANVSSIVSVSENLAEARDILVLAGQHPGFVWPSAGVHPVQVMPQGERSVVEKDVEEMVGFLREVGGRIVGVGEGNSTRDELSVGLDFSPHIIRQNPLNLSDLSEDDLKKIQRDVFARQVRIAMSLGLPVNVHSRSAGHHALDVLKECGARDVVMHAFDGKATYAKRGVEMGCGSSSRVLSIYRLPLPHHFHNPLPTPTSYYFSIPPSIQRSPQKQSLVAALPLSHLLLETDSPALGPEKGVDNEPANIVVSAREIARIKGVEFEEVVSCGWGATNDGERPEIVQAYGFVIVSAMSDPFILGPLKNAYSVDQEDGGRREFELRPPQWRSDCSAIVESAWDQKCNWAVGGGACEASHRSGCPASGVSNRRDPFEFLKDPHGYRLMSALAFLRFVSILDVVTGFLSSQHCD